VIFLPIAYWQLGYPDNFILDILAFVSAMLIIKDWFFPYKKPTNCQGIKK
jgi:hypothetical protein